MSVVLVNLVEAFLRPRISAKRILSAVRDWRTTLFLGLLAFALQALLGRVTHSLLEMGTSAGFASEPAAPAGLPPLGVALLIAFFVGMVLGVGRLFGGRASLREVVAVLAWFGVATAILVPLETLWLRDLQSGGGPSVIVAVGVGLELYALWILANFIAEAHGFRSAFAVLAGMVALMFLLGSLVVPAMLGGF